jgi:hypothetical protein
MPSVIRPITGLAYAFAASGRELPPNGRHGQPNGAGVAWAAGFLNHHCG